jgi:hypothetical protein
MTAPPHFSKRYKTNLAARWSHATVPKTRQLLRFGSDGRNRFLHEIRCNRQTFAILIAGDSNAVLSLSGIAVHENGVLRQQLATPISGTIVQCKLVLKKK